MRTILGSTFTSIFVAIYSNKLPSKMIEIVVPALADTALPASSIPQVLEVAPAGSQEALKSIPGMTDAILEVVNANVASAYGHSYAYVYYTAVALGGVSILAAFSLRDFDHYLTDHVSRQVYRKEDTKTDILETTRVEKLAIQPTVSAV